jgi:hypothetical protein
VLNAGQAVQFVLPTADLYVPEAHAAAPAPRTRTSLSTITLLAGATTNMYLPAITAGHVIVLFAPDKITPLAHTVFMNGSVECPTRTCTVVDSCSKRLEPAALCKLAWITTLDTARSTSKSTAHHGCINAGLAV